MIIANLKGEAEANLGLYILWSMLSSSKSVQSVSLTLQHMPKPQFKQNLLFCDGVVQ